MSQNYGALRVVRVRSAITVTPHRSDRHSANWLPEERLVHLLSNCETTIGRALSNDIILMDPTVSREHARLIRAEHGWLVFNLTAQNVVRVNGHVVPGGGSLALQPQDFLVLGNTMFQLIAPQLDSGATSTSEQDEDPQRALIPPLPQIPILNLTSKDTLLNGHGRQNGSKEGLKSLLRRIKVTQKSTPDELAMSLEPEQLPQPWDEEEESLLEGGVTMQFGASQRMGWRTRWLIIGGGITILVLSTIITIVLNSLIGISTFTQNGFSSIAAVLIIPLIPAVVINLLVNFIDRYEREPWFLRLAAFLWGAIIAIPPAQFIELRVDALMRSLLGQDDLLVSLANGLNAGITEESVKGLGLLLLFVVLRDEFDNITDGIVYGALIGAGFAMVENFVYFASNSKEFLASLIVGRVMLGWLSHSTFTMCFGAALGYVRHTHVRWRQLLIPFLGYLVAVGLHSIFDFVGYFANAMVNTDPTLATVSLIAIIGDYIPPFLAQIALLYILVKALAHEAAVIREFLAAEVTSGVVHVDEYALLQDSFQRTKQERSVLWHSGIKQWIRVKDLYQTEIGLAFRKWHVSMGDKPKLGYLQPEDAYRQRIKRLRQEIQSFRVHKRRVPLPKRK